MTFISVLVLGKVRPSLSLSHLYLKTHTQTDHSMHEGVRGSYYLPLLLCSCSPLHPKDDAHARSHPWVIYRCRTGPPARWQCSCRRTHRGGGGKLLWWGHCQIAEGWE